MTKTLKTHVVKRNGIKLMQYLLIKPFRKEKKIRQLFQWTTIKLTNKLTVNQLTVFNQSNDNHFIKFSDSVQNNTDI